MPPALIPPLVGATVDESGVALSFGDDEAALEALADGMVVFDRSHWVRRLRGVQRSRECRAGG